MVRGDFLETQGGLGSCENSGDEIACEQLKRNCKIESVTPCTPDPVYPRWIPPVSMSATGVLHGLKIQLDNAMSVGLNTDWL